MRVQRGSQKVTQGYQTDVKRVPKGAKGTNINPKEPRTFQKTPLRKSIGFMTERVNFGTPFRFIFVAKYLKNWQTMHKYYIFSTKRAPTLCPQSPLRNITKTKEKHAQQRRANHAKTTHSDMLRNRYFFVMVIKF